MDNKKKMAIGAAIVAAIVAAVGAIWFIKKHKSGKS